VYVTENFKTKKALRDAVAAGQTISVWQYGPLHVPIPTDGKATVEGPWYPQPHKWYGQVTLKDGKIVKVV